MRASINQPWLQAASRNWCPGETRGRDGRWYDLRMRPYRTVDDKIDGVVITFVDVTERKLLEEKLRSLVNKTARRTQT